MKLKKTRLIAMLVCIVMVLTAIAGCTGDTNVDPTDASVNTSNADATPAITPKADNVSDETELTYLFSDDITNWNYMVDTARTPAMYIDSLVEYDYLGLCQPCLAESWTRSDDGLVWTFKIREGVMWMTYDLQEYAEVTAEDWVTSCKYILDPANGSSMPYMMYDIVGAEQYYLDAIDGKEVDFSTVGVKALDKYTLEYTLNQPLPYFLSSTTYKNFFPANQQWIDECGDMILTDHKTTLYCGEFIMTQYEPSQVIVSDLNPTYWDMENMHITRITQIYNAEAGSVEAEMYLRGETNYCDVPTEQLDEWLNDPEKADMIRPCRPGYSSYMYYINFDPHFDEQYEPENWKIAVNNLNFRKAILHAFDKIALIQAVEPYNAEEYVLNTVTPSNFIASGGVDYTQLEPIAEFAASDTYDPELAQQYRDAAIQELTDAGATFPVILYIPYYTSSSTETMFVQLIESFLERNLGTDFIDVQYEGFADDGFVTNIFRTGKFSILRNYWYPDYQDPLSYADPFRFELADGRNWNYMADGMSEVSDTYVEGAYQAKDGKYYYNSIYNDMIAEAAAEVVDLNKRYLLLAEAENWLVNEQVMVIPYMRGGWGYCGSTLMPFESQYAAFGASSSRYKYQYIYEDGINTEEYFEALEAWEQERANTLAQLDAEGKVFGVDY